VYSPGRQVEEHVCYMFSESSTGIWAQLQLPCCPSKLGELKENILQNLFLDLPPQNVVFVDMVERDSPKINITFRIGKFMAPKPKFELHIKVYK